MGNLCYKKQKELYESIPLQQSSYPVRIQAPRPDNPPNYLAIMKQHSSNKFNMNFGPLKYTYDVENSSMRCSPFPNTREDTMIIATWNLQELDQTKISNPGVLETVCLVILKQRIDILTLQEIGSEVVLRKICAELNCPTLPKIQAFITANFQFCRTSGYSYVCEMTGRMHRGSEYSAVIYKTNKFSLLVSSVLRFRWGKRPMIRYPYLTVFKLSEKFNFLLISVHLKPNEARKEALKLAGAMNDLKETILKGFDCSDYVILAGDFNLAPNNREFDDLYSNGFHNLIDSSMYTNISIKNPQGTACYDNIWISSRLKDFMIGKAIVVRKDLTHPLIPNNWKWGGTVSDHCPVVATIRVPN